MYPPSGSSRSAFTLIELSIVLVIIGLIAGGVLVGRDLISAATVRAQISQIEKYNTAVYAFESKYDGKLPGDMPAADAVAAGLSASVASRTWYGITYGNGDGVITSAGGGYLPVGFESYLFWQDLSAAGLIIEPLMSVNDGGAAYPCSLGSNFCAVPAKIGQGNGVYVYVGGNDDYGSGPVENTGIDYWGLSVPVAYTGTGAVSNPGLTVSQAYAIDKKMDDGLPASGNVIAAYVNENGVNNGYGTGWGAPAWVNSSPGYTLYTSPNGLVLPNASEMPNSGAIQGDSTTCYDNGNSAGVAPQYSLVQNNGAGVNCALSFRFQ